MRIVPSLRICIYLNIWQTQIWQWRKDLPLHVSIKYLVRALASPYHSSSLAPNSIIPLLKTLLRDPSARTSVTLIQHLRDGLRSAPILLTAFFHAATGAADGQLPDNFNPLIEWLVANDELIFSPGMVHFVDVTSCLCICCLLMWTICFIYQLILLKENLLIWWTIVINIGSKELNFSPIYPRDLQYHLKLTTRVKKVDGMKMKKSNVCLCVLNHFS